MRRPTHVSPAVLVVLLLLATLIGGCVERDRGQDDETPDEDEPTVQEQLLGPHAMPMPDGARAAAWLEEFVTTYPLRVTGTPTEEEATAYLAETLRGMGYEVEVLVLGPAGSLLPANPTEALRAIVATLPGTTQPDHWIAWGGHYDTVPQAVEGAYDNGSGITVALELARMMKDVATNRTKAVLLFNGEEEGTQASSAYMDWYAANAPYTIDIFVGFDMVGIAYPAPGRPLAFFSGDAYGPEFVPLARSVAWDLLGLPADNSSVTFRGQNTRNSDEAQFAADGIPTMRFAGLQQAGDYWGYHRVNDTMETIHQMTDGPENFQAGLANTAAFAYGMLVALDVARMPERVD